MQSKFLSPIFPIPVLMCDNEILMSIFSIRRSGTWAVTGEDVIRDGSIVIPQYVRNLNKLVVSSPLTFDVSIVYQLYGFLYICVMF